jgi:hypothetical protein
MWNVECGMLEIWRATLSGEQSEPDRSGSLARESLVYARVVVSSSLLKVRARLLSDIPIEAYYLCPSRQHCQEQKSS